MQKKEEQNDGTQCLTSDAPYKLPPRPAPLGAVLLDQPLARAVELQPRAVHQQVHGPGIAPRIPTGAVARPRAARLRPRHLQRLGPAAQGGVVRHGEVEPEEADDRADQPFGLPVRQPEHGLERQRRQDRQVGIRGLPAPARAPLGLPRLDRLVGEPDRQAAAPAQALVVLAPVRDLALLLRDVVASVLVQLEGQGGHPGSDGGLPCYLDRAPGATRGIPATTWSAEVRQHAACTLTIGHIAAVAGVCAQTVRNALRVAQRLGFVHVEQRWVSAWRNRPNRVTILSPEWTTWLRMARRGGASKCVEATPTQEKNEGMLALRNRSRAAERQGSGGLRSGEIRTVIGEKVGME